MNGFKARLANAQTAAQVRHEAATHHMRQQRILKEVLLVADTALMGITATVDLITAQDIAHKARGAMSALLSGGLPTGRRPVQLDDPPDSGNVGEHEEPTADPTVIHGVQPTTDPKA